MLNFLKILVVYLKLYVVNVAYYFCCSWKAKHLYTHLKCPQAPVHITLNHVPHITIHNHTTFSGILFPYKQRGLVNLSLV
jgi:hypothetical protein